MRRRMTARSIAQWVEKRIIGDGIERTLRVDHDDGDMRSLKKPAQRVEAWADCPRLDPTDCGQR